MTIGRIGGPMLKENLIRQGVDLSVETSLVYFDVNNMRVGVNTATPGVDLDIDGISQTNVLRLSDSDRSNWLAFKAPVTVGTNVTWTLPATDGPNGSALLTQGDGTLYWGTAGSGGNITISDTAPVTPFTGDLWWNSAEGQLKIYYSDGDTNQWVDASTSNAGNTGYTGSIGGLGYTGSIGAGYTGSVGAIGYTGSAGSGGGSSVTIDNIAPSSPSVGDMWWNNEEGQLKVYYDDGSTAQWVDASSGQKGNTGYTGSVGGLGYTGSQGIVGYTGSAAVLAVTPASKTSSFTFSLSEANTTTVVDSSSAVQGLIPTDAAVSYPLGTKLRMFRKGTGSVKFVPDTGVTLNLPTGIQPKRTMGARVKLSTNLTGINPSSVYTIPWDAEAWDTDSFHDNVVNNSRITIPSGLGIKKVRISAALLMTSLTTNTLATIGITKDGSGTYEGFTQAFGTSTGIITGEFSTASGDIAVVDGTYFSAVTYSPDTNVTLAADRMGFSLTVTEIDAQGYVAYQYGAVEIEKIGTNEWIVTDHSALG